MNRKSVSVLSRSLEDPFRSRSIRSVILLMFKGHGYEYGECISAENKRYT